MTKHITPGVYRHYKGKDYHVFNIVTHTETEERMVVYRCLYGDYSWWVRPLKMFSEAVEVAGEECPRFAWVKPFSSADYPRAPSCEAEFGGVRT